jgi:hypothetical protein
MHVSGHGLVEWLQRHACAKLSETIRLAGGEFFREANYLLALIVWVINWQLVRILRGIIRGDP